MSSQPNQSLIDGIRCFQELTTSPGPLGTKELAERMGINAVRANRLLKSLQSIGMAEQNAQKKYRPGPVVHVLAAQSFHSSELFRSATNVAINTPYDDRTLAIGILWQDSVVYMYHCRAHQNPAEGLGGYHLLEASQSTIGQVLLADLDDEALAACIGHWEPAQKAAMEEIVAGIRRDGFVCRYDTEGRTDNIAASFSIGGAKAGIAFTDFQLDPAERDAYVAQLRALIEKIETNALAANG